MQKYRWQTNGFTLRIWAGDSLELNFKVPSLELVRVRKQEWLAQDRGILLELDYLYHDSMDVPGRLSLDYDFERGELHSVGDAGAWFVWGPYGKQNRQLSRKEFDEIVGRIRERTTAGSE